MPFTLDDYFPNQYEPFNFSYEFKSTFGLYALFEEMYKNYTKRSRFLYPFARLLIQHPELENQIIVITNCNWLNNVINYFKKHPNSLSYHDSFEKKIYNNKFKYKSISLMLKRLRPKFFERDFLKDSLKKLFRKEYGRHYWFSSKGTYVRGYNEYAISLSWKNKKERIVEIHILEIFQDRFQNKPNILAKQLLDVSNKSKEIRLINDVLSGKYIFNKKYFLENTWVESYFSGFVNVDREHFLQDTLIGKCVYYFFHILDRIIDSNQYKENYLLEKFLWKWYSPTRNSLLN